MNPTDTAESARTWLQSATGLSSIALNNLVLTTGLIVALMLLRWFLVRLVHRRMTDIRAQYRWRKAIGYSVVIVGLILIGRVWIAEFGSLVTFLGLLSAGIAIALRDLIVSMAGWLFIIWRHPFRPGDRIRIMSHTGDVIDLRLFQFTLLEVGTETGAGQSTGRIIHLPNSRVFTEPVVNFTRGFRYVWNEIAVTVTFESAWRDAKQILLDIANEKAEPLSEDAERRLREAAQEYMIFYSKLTPTVYTDVVEYGVRLTIRYLVNPRRRRGSEELIWEAILDAFAERSDIDLAYPTRRLYYNPREGKPDARADEELPM